MGGEEGGAWKTNILEVNYLKGGRAFLMTPWLIGIKYPEQITLCCTNTVTLLIIIIIIKWNY